MSDLPATGSVPALEYDYFPTPWQAVLFRNWNRIPLERLERVLNADGETLKREAARMGLEPAQPVTPRWDERGYLTLIRENWHLLPYGQLTKLLNMTDGHLAFILKEDDFMWHKLGRVKPLAQEVSYAPLTDGQLLKTDQAAAQLKKDLDGLDPSENAFAFCDRLTAPVTEEEHARALAAVRPEDGLRTVYSYFALYGDPLMNPELDPFPEKLLSEYARMGVKGVWLQGILYQLVRFPFDPAISEGYERRIENLNALIRRAKRYDIGVYLYLNEPRAMDDAFFRKRPHLRGIREDDYYSMCTSQPEVKEYLERGMEELFQRTEGLAGFFTITMSENLTNCISRRPADGRPCPVCSKRKPWEIVAEVNNLMARGAHRANPAAKAIAWSWAWSDEWADKVPPLLTEGQIVQCTSEEALTTSIGGIKGAVLDYTISQPGPGPKARAVWRAARESGRETCAKVQVNNTWELAAVPYIPAFDQVAAHMENLREEGVRHLQLSWTLGGAPSPNIRLASRIMQGEGDVRAFLIDWLGEKDGAAVFAAQKEMSAAFAEYPFHIGVAYNGPQNFGPAAPFFLSPTGWKATMVGFPYDDLDGWRSIYPEEVFEAQLEKLVSGWRKGTDMLALLEGKTRDLDELICMARACLCHFESMLHHVCFVRARDRRDRGDMLRQIYGEQDTVRRLIWLRHKDSRIGYEASNHYFYTMRSLEEKLINLRACESALEE